MSTLCVIYVVIASVFTILTTTSGCSFDANTIQKLYDHAISFQNKYNFGLINSNPMSHFQEQFENKCHGETCYLNYRLLNETHLDDLHESYKIVNNKLTPMIGELLHGRDYKTTKKFTRYNFERTDTGYTFKNSDYLDSENEKMFGISSNDLSDLSDLQNSRNLSPKSYTFVNDLITFQRKMINFLDGLSEVDKKVFYYHYNSDDGKNSHIEFREEKGGGSDTIGFEMQLDGSISGGYNCGIQRQSFNIENGNVVLKGEVRTTGAFK